MNKTETASSLLLAVVLGIYHLQQGDRAKAFQLFGEAKSIDPSIHKIDHCIEAAGQPG